MAQIFKAKTLVGNTGRFSNEATAPNLVYNTGEQNISGAKNFYTRPTVNGTGVLLIGEASSVVLPDTIVYTTGDQTISGLKDFTTRPTVNTIPVLLSGEVNTTISGVLYSAQINIKNNNGSTIYKGQPVYVSSAAGTNILVKLASNSGEQTSSKTLGLVYQTSLAQNAQGTIVTEGLLQGFNTNAGEEGDPIWLGPTGSLIFGLANKPYAPNHLVYLGVVTRKHANQGEVFVKIQNGFELEELHNVNINHTNALADKNIIRYNSLSGIWFNDTINSVLPNTLVYTTGDQNISGVKNFYSRPTVNGTGVLLSGEASSVTLPPTIVYTTGNQNISGLKNFSTIPTVNGTGVLLAGSPIPSTEASGAGGSIFITYVSPSGGIGNVGDYVYETPGQAIGNTALISCSTTTQNVLVDIYALQGRTRFKPKLYITGQEIPLSLVLRQDDRPVFLVNDFGVNLNNATSLRVDHEDGAYYSISITQDAPPQVLGAYFYGGYPGSQTELKAGDTFNFHVDTDVPITSIEIDNVGAFVASTNSVTAGTSHNLTSKTIADRGTSVQALGARVRVQKANGSYSAWFLTTSQGTTDGQYTVKLNNLYPSISIGTITYPVGQQALKDSEQATVSNTVSNFDSISYTSNGELTITSDTIYQTNKTVTRIAGNYNVTNNNFTIIATRTANNAVRNSSTFITTIVKIAEASPTLTVSVPAARLRTGGNDGTSTPSYTVTITAGQQLLSAPTLSIPSGGGTFLGGGFSGSGTTWTRSIQIADSLTKGTYTWGAISATNLAGRVVTTITTGPTYVIGGFLPRTVSLAAFANEVNINTSVLDYSKMTLLWAFKSLPNRRAVGTTATPDPNSWSINSLSVNPTIVRILDTAATQSSSAATNVTVEETV